MRKRILTMMLAFIVAITSLPADMQLYAGQMGSETGAESVTVETEMKETETETEQEILPMQLNYVLAESDYLTTPGTQNIVASVGTEDMQLDELVLTYRNTRTGKAYTAAATAKEQDMVLFAVSFSDEAQSGLYRLEKISGSSDGKQMEADFSALNMEVVFGVNEEADAVPDAMIYEEGTEPSSAEVEANVVTMDGNGNVISENSVEDVLDAEIAESISKNGNIKKSSNGKLNVVLDPGHDDTHAGARYNNAGEEDLVLKIALFCRDELKAYSNVEVYMVRETGSCPYSLQGGSTGVTQCNAKRVEYAVSVGADVYVSFHLNANTNSNANGVGVYYPNSNYRPDLGEEGKGLATEVYNKLRALGLTQWSDGVLIRNAVQDKYPDGSAADYLAVIRRSKEAGIPAILIEHAFISGTSDYTNFLSSDEKLKSLGVADATAIAEYYKLNKKAGKPEITYVQSQEEGNLKIKWAAVEDAVRYEVHRSTKKDSGYELLTSDVTKTFYVDSDAEYGKTYYYCIRAVFADWSATEYSDPVSGYVLAKPEINYIKSKSSKTLEINWDAVKGAQGYRLYRKDASSDTFEEVAELTSGTQTTYVDTVKSNNKKYTYKIKAYNINSGKEGESGYSEEKSGKSVGKPGIISVTSKNQKTLEITWKKVGGASGYIVKRSTSKEGKYSKIGTVSSGETVSYQDKTVKYGKTYYYKVEAFNKNDGKKGYSGDSGIVSGKTVAKTEITSVKSKSSTALEIKWEKVSDAYGYKVKRSTSKNGTYKVIKTIKSANTTSYKDTSVTAGKTYYYKVETIMKAGGVTGYAGDSDAVSGKTVKKTAINYVVSAGSTTLEINWKEVSGAYGYRIKRSTKKNGTYETIATLKGKTKTTYQDKKVKTGKTYYYKVETINRVNKVKGYSGNSAVMSGKTLAKTSVTKVKSTASSKIELTWKKVSGASGYQIYRSTKKSGSYKKIAEVSGAGNTKFTDTSVVGGKTYYYKIRAYRKNARKTGVATFSAVQKAWALEKVTIEKASASGGNKVVLQWKKAANAKGYRIYRSTNEKTGFEKIKEITSDETVKYTDASVKTGKTYYYKIVAISTIKDSVVTRGDASKAAEVPVLAAGKITGASLKEENTVLIEWATVKNADGYQLAVATVKGGTYNTLTKTGTNSYYHRGVSDGSTYYYKVRPYAVLSDGTKAYGNWSEDFVQTAGYAIMGKSSITVKQMTAYYDRKYQYPTDIYASRGAATSEEFFTILKEEADAEGVKAEVLYAQVILETGGLKFGGDVKPEQCNFGGLGATGNGVAGETFADVRTGLRAQVQHLKAYASNKPLNKACVDTRFAYVTRNSAPYVEWLAIPKNPYGKGWAADPNYAVKLLSIIKSL